MTNARRYCARVFSDAELALIRTLIAEHDPPLNRAALSPVVCERLHWRKPDGGLKDMSARVALLRMHREGVIALPPARKRPGPRKPIAPSPETDPPSLFEPPTSLEAVRPLRIEPADIDCVPNSHRSPSGSVEGRSFGCSHACLFSRFAKLTAVYDRRFRSNRSP